MKRSAFILCLLIVFSLFTAVAGGAEKMNKATAKKIQGAWSMKNMDVGTGENRSNRDDAQFMIFIMKSHYSAGRNSPYGKPFLHG